MGRLQADIRVQYATCYELQQGTASTFPPWVDTFEALVLQPILPPSGAERRDTFVRGQFHLPAQVSV